MERPQDALIGAHALERVALRRGHSFGSELYVYRPGSDAPWWQDFLSEGTSGALDIRTRTASAVLFVHAEGHLFAFTFGHGRFLLDPSSYERDFGLRVTLNAVDPHALRSVDMETIEEARLFRSVQVSRQSGLEVFDVDQVRDILRGVVGRPRDPALALALAGSDRLAFRSKLGFADLGAKCAELLATYSGSEYREHFGFIDYMRRVDEPDRRADLDERLVDALNRRAFEHLHLAPPELIRWDDFGGFRYDPLDCGDQSREEVDASEFVDAFTRRRARALTVEDVRRNVKVVVVSSNTGQVVQH